MTQPTPDIHAPFRDNLSTYLAGGLPPDATAALEAHLATCPACAAELAQARQADDALRSLFAPLAPSSDFEDNLIAGLRSPPTVRRLHPLVRRAAIGAAAAVMLGAVGYFGNRALDAGRHDRFAADEAQQQPGNWLDRQAVGANPSTQPALAFDAQFRDGVESTRGETSDRNYFYHSLATTPTSGKPAAAAPAEPPAATPPPAALGYYVPPGATSDVNGITFRLGNEAKSSAGERMLGLGPAAQGQAVAHGGSSGEATQFGVPKAEAATVLAREDPDHRKPELLVKELEAPKQQLAQNTTDDRAKLTDAMIDGDAKDKSLAEPKLAVAQADAPPTRAEPAGPGTTQPTSAMAARKIIRTGTMDFEVDSFDSAFVQITKIAAEEGGFVASTDSEKLPNGKVKGTVTLRCPPEHLDTLVLKLRGLGDLKTQRITAQDVTKQFTDFESQLKAARAMEERLLDIIKTGKGAVKDLVEAEKQLGVYREKIEQIEGELRYMGSQVALSTLNVSMTERDIRTPFAAVEAEQVSAGIEAEDVEKARADALKLIDDAKGRVIESELKKLDAGQLAATLVAEVSPDAAGPLGDRLKQLGRVARWEATRKQTAEGGSGSPGQLPPNAKLQRQPTRFSVSIYNLANVAPRQTTTLTLVANDVDAAYRAILAAVNGDGSAKQPPIGRIVTSNLGSEKSDQATGSITLEVKRDQAAAIEAALRAAGTVMHLAVTENADQNGVTDAKRGYGVTIVAAASVPAREQQTITVASRDVQATYNKLVTLLRDPKTAARVTTSQLTEPQEDNVTGSLDFEIPIANRPSIDAVLADGKQADVISRNVVRSADTENTLPDKLRLTVSIGSAERLPPRETTRLTLEAADVSKALDTAAGVGGSDARVIERSLNQQPSGVANAHLVIDVPLSAAQATLDQLRALGSVRAAESSRDAKVSAGPLARARFEVQLENTETLVPPQEGIGASIQRGLKTALNGLLWSVQMVVVGLVLVGPFAIVLWALWRLLRRPKRKPAAGPVV